MSITLLLVDDHTILRQGLKLLLQNEQDIAVIAEAANGLEAIQQARELHPDVVVMDLNMPEMNGIEASRQILNDNPAIKIIILSMTLDQTCVSEALKAGVTGYVLKDCVPGELVSAIRSTITGFPYLCQQVTALVVKEYAQDSGKQHPLLSKREREVLKFIADGKSLKEISFIFGVSTKTVEAQRMNIMKKLDLHSVADLTKYAVREGLSSLS